MHVFVDGKAQIGPLGRLGVNQENKNDKQPGDNHFVRNFVMVIL
jgi:hypothetical protein